MYMLLCVSVQFSCAARVSGSDDEFILSNTSYFVGIRFWTVRYFLVLTIA